MAEISGCHEGQHCRCWRIHGGTDTATGGYFLPSGSSGKLEEAILSRSLFRNLATVVKAYGGSSRIFAKDTSDLCRFGVPETTGDIPHL